MVDVGCTVPLLGREVEMTIRPKNPKPDAKGAALLKKLKDMAKTESQGDHFVEVRVTPKKHSADGGCSCCCG